MASAYRIFVTLFLLCIGSVHAYVRGSLEKVTTDPNHSTSADLRLPTSVDVHSDYEDLQATIATLQQQLHSSQEQAMASLQSKRQEYDTLLREDLTRRDSLLFSNTNIEENIDAARRTNQQLRKETQSLVIENKKLSEYLELTLSNITLAKEFAVMSLKEGEMNFSSPELDVLSELSDRDQEAKRNQERSRMLKDIENGGSRVSLSQYLSRQPDMDIRNLDPRSLVQALSDFLEDIPNQQKVREESLAEQFTLQQGKIRDAITALLEDQVSLNQTLSSELAIQTKLYDAQQFLEDIHTKLVQRSAGLKDFEMKLGRQRILNRSDAQTEPVGLRSTPISEPISYTAVSKLAVQPAKGKVDIHQRRGLKHARGTI